MKRGQGVAKGAAPPPWNRLCFIFYFYYKLDIYILDLNVGKTQVCMEISFDNWKQSLNYIFVYVFLCTLGG